MPRIFTSLTDPRVAEALRQGAVGIIPTDTVYGLVARAEDQAAVLRLYTIKQRDIAPGTMIGAAPQEFERVGFPATQLARVAHYWPAPLSVVLDATNVPGYLKHTRDSLPVRVPADDQLRELLAQIGPLMTTSANTPKAPTSRTIDEAVAYFGNAVDFYVDAGDLGERPPSTIIGYAGDELVVYRAGAVDPSTLK
jgi:tRNA threonylcarbamoyl adenosine modification protein (Sua5/YciO/YrdC/YwlC family)